MALRRTFWGWKDRNGRLVTTAAADISADRLPWVSIKPPTVENGSAWAAIGGGEFDTDIDELLTALDALDGPVWLTFHHEPEGGGGSINGGPDDIGGAAAWRAAQIRFRNRIDVLGVDNVAFVPILMAWTWDSRSGRNPADWWVDGIWDFYGLDTYQESEPAGGPHTTSMFVNAHNWLSAKGIDIAIAEWGNRGSDTAAASDMSALYDYALTSGTSSRSQVIGVAAFDSGLNSPSGSWELTGEPLTRFHQLIDASTSAPLR